MPGLNKQTNENGGFGFQNPTIQHLTVEQVFNSLKKKPAFNYDGQTTDEFTIEQLDEKQLLALTQRPGVNNYIKDVTHVNTYGVAGILECMGVYRSNRPTIGLVLCLGKADCLRKQFSSCCKVQIVRYRDDRKFKAAIDLTIETGNIISLFEFGVTYLKEKAGLEKRGEIGTPYRDELEIPEFVLKEALANAFMHRNYEDKVLRDQPNRIEIYPSRIEITSFGSLLCGITERQLNEEPATITPIRRNDVIAAIFQIMQYAELNATGIGRMKELCRARGIPEPMIKYDETIPTVKVIIERPKLEQTIQVFNYAAAKSGINNLPHGSIGGLFKGRGEEIEELRKTLCEGKATAITPPEALYGLGGIGKTRLALEFAWAALDEGIFKNVFFVNCGITNEKMMTGETRNQKKETAAVRLQAAINVLAGPSVLNIEGAETARPEAVFGAVLAELSRREKQLIIFDNVDDIEMRGALLGLLPRLTANVKVLVTSRLTEWGNALKAVEIEKVNIEAAMEYLQDSTEGQRQKSGDDRSLAETLAKKLDGLPAALEQAAAHIRRERIGFNEYLRLYERNLERVLDNPELAKVPGGYERTVAATWQMTVSRLGAIERVLLKLSAFLAPDNIPEELFGDAEIVTAAVKQIEGHTVVVSKNDIHRAIQSLADWSMIKRRGKLFSIHRLVQVTTRLRMNAEAKKATCGAIVELLNQSIPREPLPNDVQSWGYWKQMETHVAEAIEHGLEINVRGSLTKLMNCLGMYYRGQARNAEAEPLYERALAIDEEVYGKDHPDVAIQLNNLAALYQTTNRLNEAELLYKRALSIDEKAYGKDHPDLATRLNNLAALYAATNRLNEAESLYERALAIDEKAHGKDHPDVATRLSNLAALYMATNRLKEAETFIERSLLIDEKTFGKDHPKIAIRVNNLAQLYQVTGRLKEAEPLMGRALAIDEKTYGKNHPKVASRLNNLAQLYQATNRLKEAKPLMKRALAIDEKTYGKDHPDVARDLNNLAVLYQATNRLKKAEPLSKRHLEIFVQFTRRTGHAHPHLETAVRNYTGLLMEMGYKEEEVRARLKEIWPEIQEHKNSDQSLANSHHSTAKQ